MSIIILLIGFLSQIAGIILLLISLNYRLPNHPGITGEGGIGPAFWKCRQYYNPPGYRLFILANIFFDAGILLQLIFYWCC
ncbi:MAG: hypothetical protein NTV06_02495 [candidate division Zixibacteria bacterium]|nr:hypothetical protein [candidate division Zixibacteria bacterium]